MLFECNVVFGQLIILEITELLKSHLNDDTAEFQKLISNLSTKLLFKCVFFMIRQMKVINVHIIDAMKLQSNYIHGFCVIQG